MIQPLRPRPRRTALRLLAGLSLAVAGLPTAVFGTDLSDVRQRGELIVLCYLDAKSPFLGQGAGGVHEGVDISVLRTLATALDVELRVREITPFEDLIPALLRNEGDLIAGGFSITEERKTLVDYSIPYFPVVVMVVARKDSRIATIDDLPPKRGAVVRGTTHGMFMTRMGLTNLVPIPRAGDAYDALRRGAADFAFVDAPIGLVNLEDYPELMTVGMLPYADYYGFAVAKGSDLPEAMDRHLAAVRSSGLLYNIFRRHLGQKAVETYQLFKKTSPSSPLP